MRVVWFGVMFNDKSCLLLRQGVIGLSARVLNVIDHCCRPYEGSERFPSLIALPVSEFLHQGDAILLPTLFGQLLEAQ